MPIGIPAVPERDPVGGVHRRPFTEQVAFFRAKLKNLVPTARWDDMLREAHDDGFMVAGAIEADLLTDLAAAVDKTIAEGTGIEAFRKDFRAIVRRRGWTGWAGEGSIKGEAWRVGTIYRTNMATSYAAGRLAQLRAGNFKYWVYRHGGSLEPRPEHLSWDGVALPPDHPFWETHYPPSDWGCSCYVVGANSEAGIKRLGGDPGKKLPDNWRERDPKTGAPLGIGRGWDYAPGATRTELINAMAGKIRQWDYAVAKAFMDALPAARADALSSAYRNLPTTADDARRYAQRVFDPNPDLGDPPAIRTLGRIPNSAADRLVDDVDVRGFDFSLTASEIRHVIAEHGNEAFERARGQRAVTAADFATLPRLVEQAVPLFSGMSRGRRPTITFSAPIAGERHEAVFEVRRGRRTATLLSYRIGRKRIDAPPA